MYKKTPALKATRNQGGSKGTHVPALLHFQSLSATDARHWLTTALTHEIAWSTSSAVVYRPKLNLTVLLAASSSSPIAVKTCDGVPAAELHADVEEIAKSLASMNGKKPGSWKVRLKA